MARCIYCDYSDTAGSLSTPVEGRPRLQWDHQEEGFVCSDCRFEEADEEELDMEFDDE